MNPEPQILDCDGENKVSTICMCAVHNIGQYCLSGTCSALPAACDESEDEPITYECACGGKTCASGYYCYDGRCNQFPKRPSKNFKIFMQIYFSTDKTKRLQRRMIFSTIDTLDWSRYNFWSMFVSFFKCGTEF